MTTVVKIGGARAVDPEGALADVASLVDEGEEVVLTHGGSTAVDETLEDLGQDPTYVETPGGVVGRFTDEDTMDVFKMVMPGKLNTDLVESLHNEGVNAVGLSGTDGKLLEGKRKSAVRVKEDGKKKILRGDHSGTIESVNADLLETILAGGYTPVVSVPVLGREKEGAERRSADNSSEQGSRDGGYTAVNADADRAAAAIAGALEADLIVLTDVSGIYEDPDDESTKIDAAATPAEFETVKTAAEGFMTKKVMAAEEALEGGAASVTVASANAGDPITSALAGEGTTLEPGALGDAETADADTTPTEATQ
ncbi:acetylglutamate/acetylaminoadipate kinase [Natrialba hulunbeirensis JCM 10989]|uniref:Putative [LysW]-aminoadipate/[LysW]-glutamate kinase n=1 Tax=Natrialba hulunbeirensis JCM 10989 TaxID=1227493 RepID=L9ZZP9_9EURY|nr:acetylglutamate/acetylaminoadipate kinase [Natrialba hulunbeirensis]ELY91052.1 acetylglutamate/acetylaminoadipate kinase [Natrialba hulunbeirensis JCM 10989]